MLHRRWIIALFLIVLTCLPCYAADITLRWDANTETDLAGYKLYYKADTPGSPYDGAGPPIIMQTTDPGGENYIDPDIINNPTPEYTLVGVDINHIYFLVLTAYDTEDNESGYSNEVSTFYISSPQDGFTISSNSYEVSGRTAANRYVEVFVDGIPIGTTTADEFGRWSADCGFEDIDDGEISLSADTDTITSNTVIGTLNITGSAGGGGGSSGGCFIGSTEKVEKLLIEITAILFFMFVVAMAIIGLNFIVSVVSLFDSDVKVITLTSSIMLFLITAIFDLSYRGIPIELMAVVALFFLGVCNILIMSGKVIGRRFVKC